MRVLLITGSLPPMRCGVGDYSHSLAKALAMDPANHIGVLTSECGGKTDNLEIFPVIKKWSLSESFKVIKTIYRWSPDIVHIQYPTQGYGDGFLPWILPLIAFMMRKSVVQTWHESYGRRSALKLFLKGIVPGGLVVVRPQYKEILPVSLHWALWHKQYAIIRNASPFPKVDLVEKHKIDLKKQFLKGQERLIVFFGFVYPNKGAELLFEIADPALDQIVIAGEIVEASEYQQKIMKLATMQPWEGKVTVTGFLQPNDIAILMSVADAVILPFRAGGGEWNTSIHAAVLQGSFVITTSKSRFGYDEKHNTYYAKVDDVKEMKSALDKYAGTRRKNDPEIDRDEWGEIAHKHLELYESLLHK